MILDFDKARQAVRETALPAIDWGEVFQNELERQAQAAVQVETDKLNQTEARLNDLVGVIREFQEARIEWGDSTAAISERYERAKDVLGNTWIPRRKEGV